MPFFTCFKLPKVKGNTTANTQKYMDTQLLSELNNTLSVEGLSVAQYNNKEHRLDAILTSIPSSVCKDKGYLMEIIELPTYNQSNDVYVMLVSTFPNANLTSRIVAVCYYEVSKTNCTIHLICNNHPKTSIKVGEALMTFVIKSVQSRGHVDTISLVAETEKGYLDKLVNYYKQFGFEDVQDVNGTRVYEDNYKSKQPLSLNISKCNKQSGGIKRDYIQYNKRKYLVRINNEKKKYIISKGVRIYLNTIKYSKV